MYYDEQIELKNLFILLNYRTGQQPVYDSSFTLLYGEEDHSYALVFRTNPDLTLTPDNIGDKGVEVD
ncbi:MAG: hypothetical protein J1E06_06660 [Acutalibacter sp.]|nr:hypothetical protein [Acutalibacter sp.]